MSERDDWRDDLRDWWDEDETASVESSFPIIARLIASERADATREAAISLRGMAVEEFDMHGPLDPRGGAIWDSAAWLFARADQVDPTRPTPEENADA